MKAVLLRVGIDTGSKSGGILGPLFPDGTFEFIPIKDTGDTGDPRTYGNTAGRHGRRLFEYFHKGHKGKMQNQTMHSDPEFKTYTYGDPTRQKRGLKCLEKGDLLIFYCGLRSFDPAKSYDENAPSALYLLGYLLVAERMFLKKPSMDELARARRLFSRNFHVIHRRVLREDVKDGLVLIRGDPERSRLLRKACRISDEGKYVLSRKMRKHFGRLGKKGSLKRSSPRWIAEEQVRKVRAFLASLE